PVQWPVTADKPDGTARMFEDKQFFTSTGKAQLIAIKPRQPVNAISDEYPLILNTGRVRDQWHTMTRTARSARLNAHIPEPIVQIHPLNAENLSLEEGSLARLSSLWGNMLARVVVTEEQSLGSVFVPMHWNDFLASRGRVNALVNPVVDPISNQPEFKHTPVNISAYKPAWHGFILSRKPLLTIDSEYWVKIKGEQFWRYELAGENIIDDIPLWAREQLGEEGEWLEFSDQELQRFRVAKVQNNRLESCVFIASTHELPTRTWLSQLFSEQTLTNEARMSLLAGKSGAGIPDIGPMVCACFGVGENTIKEAFSSGKAKTVDDIGNLLKAGTNCGSCIPEIQKLFN
ncbi:MAG: nitrate reductase, partial [Methylophaga sp.]|nr:nitrate reductase [Methylophaga sp.]